MTSEELRQKYEHLYNKMMMSDDARMMYIFGGAEKWAFDEILKSSPKMAEMWVDKLEAINWNNYVSEAEAKMIASKFINQDGITGPKWEMSSLLAKLDEIGCHIEHTPYYNKYALWLTINMLYSDHAISVSEDMGYATPKEAPTDKMVVSFHKKAVEKLCDKDRPFFIRKYFCEELD